jgi:hypothetical protein
MLLPLVVGLLIALHVLLVRRRGVVPPYPARGQVEFDTTDDGGESR